MNFSFLLSFLASLLAAVPAANSFSEENGKLENTALHGSSLAVGEASDSTADGTANSSVNAQPSAQLVHEPSATTESRTSAYDYSSVFERIAKAKGGHEVPVAPPSTETSPEPSEPWTPQPPDNGEPTEDEIAEDEEIELDGDVELPPLRTYLQRDHYESLGEFISSMRTRFDMAVHNDLSEQSRYIAAKVNSPRSSIGKVFDSVLDNDHVGYFQPVQAERLRQLHLLGIADEDLHTRRAQLADAQGLPYVPKRWITPSSSAEVMKIKRGPLINHGFASATYAVRRIFPYKDHPGRSQAEKEGALKVFIVKRKAISENLAEDILLHQCSVWKALPPERSEELAEHSHLLYPVSVLKMVEDKSSARKKKPKKSTAAPDSEYDAQREPLNDLLDSKILNLFVLYPRAYDCTLKFFIVSRGRTDLLTKIAPMKVMISISIQMIYAVAQLNSHGFVHTRIRPTSFVITRDGKVLLTDFFSVVQNGTHLSCFQQAVPMAMDINSSPEEAQCTDRVPGYTYEATYALDSWRLGTALYKLWCRESWDPSTDVQKWEQELERRRRIVQARTADPYKSVQRYNRHKLALKHCRKDTPSFILRLIQQFLEPNPEARLTAVDAVRGTSLFKHMERRIQAAEAVLESIKRQRRREEL